MTSGMLTGTESPIRPLVELSDAHLRLDAGQVGQTELTVRNPGNIVETYDLIILGQGRPVTDITPSALSLFPGEENTATLEFRPPLSHRVWAGTYAVGVKVQSQVRPEISTTAEMLVTINPFYRFHCTMRSTSVTLRTRATVLVEITNDGNSTVTYEVKASDPEGFMRVAPREPRITLAPGESRWTEVTVKVAPKLIGSEYNTRSFTVTVTPVLDEDLGLAIVDEDSEQVIGSVLHRPYVRLRLGVFGRLLILLTILGLIAAFFISRWLSTLAPPVQGPPDVPSGFIAQAGSAPSQVLLEWLPSVGAEGYTIYSIGEAGNPQPTPQPTILVEIPGQTGSSAGGVARSVMPRVMRDPTIDERATPVCLGCTEVASLDLGVTRYVVQDVPPGVACYRIAARAGGLTSLFSFPACTEVEDPLFADLDGDGIPDGFQDELGGAGDENLPPRPCPPVNVEARPLSTNAIALLWGRATTPPSGFRAPRNKAFGEGETPAGGRTEQEPRGGAIPSDGTNSSSTSSASGGRVCDPSQEITGWIVQRQIFSGWADVSPAPGVDDTALEAGNLEPDTRYCFRMRAKTEQRVSRWSPRTCAKTDAEPIVDSSVEPTPQSTSPVSALPGETAPPMTDQVTELTSQLLKELPR